MDTCRKLDCSGNHSANLLDGSLHHAGSWFGRIFDVIQTRPLLSIIGLWGSAGLYGGLPHRCCSPHHNDGRLGLGKRDGTSVRGARVGISSSNVLFSFGSSITSEPCPAETAYTRPPPLIRGLFFDVETSSCMNEWSV